MLPLPCRLESVSTTPSKFDAFWCTIGCLWCPASTAVQRAGYLWLGEEWADLVALPFQTVRGSTPTCVLPTEQAAAHTNTHDTGTTSLGNNGTLQRPCYLFPLAARQQIVEG